MIAPVYICICMHDGVLHALTKGKGYQGHAMHSDVYIAVHLQGAKQHNGRSTAMCSHCHCVSSMAGPEMPGCGIVQQHQLSSSTGTWSLHRLQSEITTPGLMSPLIVQR